VIFVARLGEQSLAAASLAISIFGVVTWSLSGLTGSVAALIAAELGEDPRRMLEARRRLGDCLLHRPEQFDRTWPSKARYSMDWFYPVLTGVIRGEAARRRLDRRWNTFVEPGLGCRCVSDRPWVTIAETCELAMACIAAGARHRAQKLFDDVRRYQAEDGSWWTGHAFEDDVLWPDERPTWTAGAVLLAADALARITPASGLFTRHDFAAGESADALQHAEGARAGQLRVQSRR